MRASTNLRIASDSILQYNLLIIYGYAARRRFFIDMVNRSQSLGSLEFLRGPPSLVGRSYSLSLDNPEITIGRAPANTLVIDDPHVSGQHARLLYNNGRWYVQKL